MWNVWATRARRRLTGIFWRTLPPLCNHTPAPTHDSWPQWGAQETDLQRGRVDSRRGFNHQTKAAVIMKTIARTQQCYLQAARCLSSERSWCCWRHCRCSLQLQDTGRKDLSLEFAAFLSRLLSYFIAEQTLFSPESSWPLLCRLSSSLNAPGR